MSQDVKIMESRTRGPVDEAEGQAATIAETIYRERVRKVTDDVVIAGGAGGVSVYFIERTLVGWLADEIRKAEDRGRHGAIVLVNRAIDAAKPGSVVEKALSEVVAEIKALGSRAHTELSVAR